MSKKILLLFVALCTTIASWGFAVNEEVTGSQPSGGVDQEGNTYTSAEGFTFRMTKVDFVNNVYECNVKSYTGSASKVTVPGYIWVDQEGGKRVQVVSSDKTPFGLGITEITFEEGLKNTGQYYTFTDAHDLEVINLPSTLTDFSDWHLATGMSKMRKITIGSGSPVKVLKTNEGADCVVTADGSLCILLSLTESGATPDHNTATLPSGIVTNKNGGLGIIGNDNYETIVIPKTYTDVNLAWGNGRNFMKGWKVESGNPVYNADLVPGDKTQTYGGVLCKDDVVLNMPPGYVEGHYEDPNDVNLEIGGGYHKVAHTAISNVKGIGSVSLAHTVTEIESSSFSSIGTLVDFHVYECTIIGDGFVTGCPNVNVILEPCTDTSHTKLWTKDPHGVIYSADFTELLLCPKSCPFTEAENYSYTVDPRCKDIHSNAFSGINTLQHVNLSNVEKIYDSAFYPSDLQEIMIPKSVTEIGKYAFHANPNLSYVAFENALPGSAAELEAQNPLSISSYAFQGGIYETVTIPSRATSVGAASFTNGVIKEIIVGPGSQMQRYEKQGNESTTEKVFFHTGLEEACNVKTIYDGAFQNMTALKSVQTIPPTVETLGANAFFNTPNLAKIQFDKDCKIKKISKNTFQNCGVTSLDLPSSIETIEYQAFNHCAQLGDITIPATCTSCSNQAFSDCPSITAINVDKSNPVYSSGDGIMMTKDKKKLYIYPGGKSCDKFTLLPPSLEEIGEYAFYLCRNLEMVVIPKHVKKIGNYAFCGCDALNKIYFLGTDAAEASADYATDLAAGTDRRFTSEDGTVSTAQFLKNNVTIYYPYPSQATKTIFTNTDLWGDCKSYVPAQGAGNDKEVWYDMDNGKAILLKTLSSDYTYVVPEKVNGLDLTYISDFAFDDIRSNVEEIVFRSKIEYLGVNLFETNAPKNIFFAPSSKDAYAITTSTDLFDIGIKYFGDITKTYAAFKNHEDINVYVPYDMHSMNTSKEFKPQKSITPTSNLQLYTQIPLPAIANTNSTISREFDIDLANRPAHVSADKRNVGHATSEGSGKPEELGNKPDVCAYVAYKKNVKEGSNWVSIVLESVNCGVEGADGTYIPAGCGALIQATPGKAYDATDFTYEIGMNKSINSVSNNVFSPMVENPGSISPMEDGKYNYYIYEGKFWNVPATGMSFPVHKAYLSLDEKAQTTTTSGKRLLMFFSKEEADAFAVTGIKGVNVDTKAGVIYDLSGRRVSAPQKGGVYVKNGKKVVL